ncbi:MAG: TIM barrel protein [Anaerolineaceae bacterium]|nr:TIM barrel protein [Anaerolineaceae bacterium]
MSASYVLSFTAEFAFRELPFEERVRVISDAGFLVDFGFAANYDLSIFKSPGMKAGSFVATTTGSILHPDDVDALVDGVAEAIATAREIGSKNLVLLEGVLGPNGETIHRIETNPVTRWITAYKALERVAKLAEEGGVTLCLEHLNTKIDHVGYGIGRVEEAVSLVREVNSPNLKITLDLYHAQVEEGNVIELIRKHINHVGLVHVADSPGRHEPGTGELHYGRIAQVLNEVGYTGPVGFEGFPTGDSYAAMNIFRDTFTLD